MGDFILAVCIFMAPIVLFWLFNYNWRKNVIEAARREVRSIVDEEKRRLQKESEEKLAAKLKDYEQKYAKKKEAFTSYMATEKDLLMQLHKRFSENILSGRKWAADYLAEIYAQRHELIAYNLTIQKRAARKAAEEIKSMRQEKKQIFAENLLLKQKLNLYRDYFPFLADLDEEIMCNPSDEFSEAEDIDQTFDRARKYLTAEEYQKLSTTDKNQLALDRYLSRNLSKVQIGRLYEMYLGWLYEKNGYIVTYNGIEQGVEDMGRDLICIKPTETVIVQAKCWSQSKTIHEKHVYQLYGTVCTYKIEHPEVKKVRAFLYVTNQLSPVARAAAQMLKIKVEENFALDKSFPMIKCNIGRSGEKIYHLPFDQQYNKTQIKSPGEMYCRTVAEAEANGFRRAKRYFSNPRASHVTP